MRVIVCGGRDYADKDAAVAALDRFHAQHGITCLIQGGAKGADRLAYEWAASRFVIVHNVPADWKKHGKAAGPIRNQQMIDEHQPNALIAFPGGRGTDDMIKRAKEAGLPVYRPVKPMEGC
ncbi:hypothetical protein PARHAE_00778 [Paracoccus haematequi]|uniref:YspA cpYpsA-related SLOG domain-containing protein n=1 Tax=Paracoccus haematequi TaxID=2491866 RepID=A0A447IJG6_9RHOB|nr:DUF2493 domain-containing protein [Paracoccus haematequi]VDS07601.1 hypothetical protein PARHAE_00778 [Paracoccus haematequi]